MTGKVLTGYRHDLQISSSKLSGHLRAIVWGLIAAGIVCGVGR